MRLMVGQEYIDWMRVQWEDKKTTFLRQQMLLAVYSSPMGDSDVFTFAIRQPYSSHQPTKHSSTIAYRRRQSLGQRHRRKIPPRDFHAALAHASLDAPGLQCDPARDLASGSPAQSCLPRGPCPPFPLDEIVCVSKFSIASARSTVTRTSTTPLAKRPSRHLSTLR